jgi:glycosyltransferase involved in cell wall biosynthesis
MKIGVVIPTLNEEKNLASVLPKIKNELGNPKIFIIDDRSKDDTVEIAKTNKAVVPYTKTRLGYGQSLIKGITKAFYEYNCDIVIQMDADHPTTILGDMVIKLATNHADLIIGTEIGSRTTRGFACWLARKFLGLKHSHPTCGLRAWSKNAFKRIDWRKMKAQGFSIQIETLFWAQENELTIKEKEFKGGSHKKLPFLRILEWLGTLVRLTLRRISLIIFLH